MRGDHQGPGHPSKPGQRLLAADGEGVEAVGVDHQRRRTGDVPSVDAGSGVENPVRPDDLSIDVRQDLIVQSELLDHPAVVLHRIDGNGDQIGAGGPDVMDA